MLENINNLVAYVKEYNNIKKAIVNGEGDYVELHQISEKMDNVLQQLQNNNYISLHAGCIDTNNSYYIGYVKMYIYCNKSYYVFN